MKSLVANQEKTVVVAFSVIVQLGVIFRNLRLKLYWLVGAGWLAGLPPLADIADVRPDSAGARLTPAAPLQIAASCTFTTLSIYTGDSVAKMVSLVEKLNLCDLRQKMNAKISILFSVFTNNQKQTQKTLHLCSHPDKEAQIRLCPALDGWWWLYKLIPLMFWHYLTSRITLVT